MLAGIALGVLAFWFFTTQPEARNAATDAARKVRTTVDQFRVDDIKEELARTGSVVREKARSAGNAISDAASDARITASIKAKFLTDSDLPALQISVSTTDGMVTLSGKAPSAAIISKAVRIAFDIDGVVKVFSTIQVPPSTTAKP